MGNSEKKRFEVKSVVAEGAAWLALLYTCGIILRVEWKFIDYLYPVLFNPFFIGFNILYFLVVLSFIMTAICWVSCKVRKIQAPDARANWFFRATRALKSVIAFMLTCYGLTFFAAVVCIDRVLGPAALLSFLIAGMITRKIKEKGAHVLIRLFVAIAIFTVSITCTGILTGNPQFYQYYTYLPLVIAACFWAPLFPTLKCSSVRQLLFDNRYSLVTFGVILFFIVMFGRVLWWQGAVKMQRQYRITQNADAGVLAAISLTDDRHNLFVLNKSAYSVQLIEKDTLKTGASIPVIGYPRQMAADDSNELVYVVVHSVGNKQFMVFSENPLKLEKTIDFPSDECDQANSINIDYERNRIIVGCDDRNVLYHIDRGRLELVPSQKKYTIKGFTVRIEVDDRTDEAYVFGCFNGPYINVVDLVSGRTKESKYTGYMVWETLFDAAGQIFFASIPFRSMVAVIDENSLETIRRIPAGFGARAIALDTKNNLLYIGSQLSNTVAVHDLKSLEYITKFYVPGPRSILYDDEEKALYIAGDGLYRFGLPPNWPGMKP